MRVIAGRAKGHRLKFPKGTQTRPATDLVRGAIFSILANITDDWSQVLDLFSGSGALGIEALSRGAGWVDFVEYKLRCCDIIKDNLAKTKLAGQAFVHCCSVERALSLLDKEYNIILMDPPYFTADIEDVMMKLATSGLVGAETVVVVTHSPHRPMSSSFPPLSLLKEHRHGDSCIALYKQEVSS
ncbi:16S rRNA (guanine(966)-N(2))-methyltransferase RsmD [Chloroflexota bacterium]